jgi:2-polyprenyl-3-methyl-5-hydroxy-6-metoxy-1,4-benzoquinol methylase
VDPEILEDWMAFLYHCGRRMPEYDFFLGIKTKSEQFRARNAIVEAAQQHNCDRILMLDDDMIIDWQKKGSEAYRFLEQLIAHDKDICGILYFQRGQECEPVLMTKLGEKGYRFLRDDEIEHGLQKVDVAGGGCLLIKTKVFDRLAFPYFAPEFQYGTDVQLCRNAADKAIEVWADTSIEFGHLRNEKVTVHSRNRHQFQDSTPQQVNAGKLTFVASEVYGRLVADAMEYTGLQSEDDMWRAADRFYGLRKQSNLADPDWYRLYPMERVCRQVWFNTQSSTKKKMTQFILAAISHNRAHRILDFGCGMGLTAFTLAEKGHDVTAMDIRGTGTFEFLKWRCKKHGVNIRFIETEGGCPQLPRDQYDMIIAMDSIEHIEQWKETVAVLSEHLRPEGILFSNNGILEDLGHQEHYPVYPKDFIHACVEANLMPHTQISFVKREDPSHAESTDSRTLRAV